MKKLLLLLGIVAFSGNLFAATYYIDWVAGNDANNGQSKASPWKRAPGMAGFAGSYSHVAGDVFIFKGGVTWPTSCYQWKITWGGSSTANRDTYTTDVTWYTGGSFSRPKFDFENRSINGWSLGAGVLVHGANYVRFDNLEFMRHRCPWATGGIQTWGTATICFDTADECLIYNCVIRDWDHPPGVISGASGGGGVIRINSGNNRVLNTLFHQDNVTQKNGTAMWNMAEIGYCEVRNTPTAVMYSGWATEGVHHNYIHDLPDPADPAAHSNAILSPGGRRIYNNRIHTATARAQIIFINAGYYGAAVDLIYNNIIYNVAQPGIAIDTDELNAAGSKSYIFNNTIEGAYSGSGLCMYSGYRNNGAIPHIELRNNHFIANGNPITLVPGVTDYTHSNNLTNTVATATGLGYVSGTLFAPLDGSKPTVGTGYDRSSFFTTDYNLGTRTVPWDIGAHEYGSVTGPGTLVISTASQSVSEEGGSVTVTVYRTSGSTGAVGCSYWTADGDATSGVNYTTASGTLSWANGESGAKTFSVTILDADMTDNKSFTASISSATGGASLGTPTTQTITINGSSEPAAPVLTGTSWPATNGVVTLPFYSSTNVVVQAYQTLNPLDGGRASYTFTNAAGIYTFTARVKAPSGAADSFFWNVNAEPTAPEMIFDILDSPLTNFTDVVLGHRGTNDYGSLEFPVKYVSLLAGTNTLIIRGREAGCEIENLSISVHATEIPPQIVSCTSTTDDGYYKAGSNVSISILWSTNVTVTGTPLLAMNAGGNASYTSGSGTTTLVFTYHVVAGYLSDDLDYADENALTLNGGTISEGANSAVLTLPTPGCGGSIAGTKAIVIDTTPPTITITGPIPSVTQTGPIIFNVVYDDTNWGVVTLDTPNIEVLTSSPGITGDDITINGPQDGKVQVVTVGTVSFTEVGTLRIRVTAGSAADLAGNLAPISAYSDPLSVRGSSYLRATIMRVNSIIRP